MDVNATGKWEKVVTYEGACGKSKTSKTPVASQQIQFRVDSIEPTMKCAVINEIKPPVACLCQGKMAQLVVPNYAHAYSANVMRLAVA